MFDGPQLREFQTKMNFELGSYVEVNTKMGFIDENDEELVQTLSGQNHLSSFLSD